MNAEIIAVGTEILLGQIVNTNTAFLSQQLAELGIDSYYQTVVGDNEQRLRETIKIAMRRNNLVILTGGLGPTKDDITKQTVARILNKRLVTDKSAMKYIEDYFKTTGKQMTENNRLQAQYIEGAIPLKNDTGMAVGMYYEDALTSTNFLLLPGPPSELKPMFNNYARQILQSKGAGNYFYSKVLRFFGIGESQLVTELDDLITNQTNPTIAPYAKTNEVTLRLTASADSFQHAQHLVNSLDHIIQARVGQYFYGYGDDNSLPKVVIDKLSHLGLTLGVDEGFTSGLFYNMAYDVQGSDKVLDAAYITPTDASKQKLLSIPLSYVYEYGSFSEEVASWLSKKTKQQLDTDLAVAILGNISDEKQEGQIIISLTDNDNHTQTKKITVPKSKSLVKERAVLTAFDMINKNVEKQLAKLAK